jgi:pyruvate dehydrogenase E2 component (dihydrolipoamide acetyltransferase)
MAWVTMPQLGETVAEGTIGRWLKQVGDRVERGEPIVEVVTDKVNAEVPSDVAGVVREILVPEGASAAPGARLALVADVGESAALAGPVAPATAILPAPATLAGEEGSAPDAPTTTEEPAAAEPAPVGEPTPAAGPTPVAEPGGTLQPPALAQPRAAGPPAPPAAPPISFPPGVPDARAGQPGRAGRVTPAVQRLVRENDVDLGDIPGTGTGGRVTVEDVLAFLVRRRLAAGGPEVGLAPPDAAGPAAAAATRGSASAAVPTPSLAALRAPTALTVEADMSGVVALIERSGPAYATQAGIELTPIAFIVKAAVDSLQGLPDVPSSEPAGGSGPRRGRTGRQPGIAVGVTIHGPTSTVHGIVADADRLSLNGVNRALHDLAAGPASGTVRPAGSPGLAGTALLVEDAGSAGALSAIPEVPPGQAVALSAGAILARPVAVESGGGIALGVRRVAVLTAAWDPDLLPAGAVAAFLARVRARLEAVDGGTPIY